MSQRTGTLRRMKPAEARHAVVGARSAGARAASRAVLAAAGAAPREAFVPAGARLEQVCDPDGAV